MANRQITFDAETTKDYMANFNPNGTDYNTTIQNNTNQSITITVSNLNTNRGQTPVFDQPAQGALTIAAGDNGALTEPYVVWRLTAGLAATGTVDIVEA